MYNSKVNVDFWLCLKNFLIFFGPKIFFLDSIIFPQKKFGDLTLSNLPLTNTTSSFSTTSTSSISSTNRRSTGLHPYIYSRLWLFQMRTSASRTEAGSICLFRTFLSFRVKRNIAPLWVFEFCHKGNDVLFDSKAQRSSEQTNTLRFCPRSCCSHLKQP